MPKIPSAKVFMYWMITNRNVKPDRFGDDYANLTYWRNPSGDVKTFKAWEKITPTEFRQGLVDRADQFPDPLTTPTEDQKHVGIFVHGFDTSWDSATERYGKIVANLFTGRDSLGECVLFSWPSNGNVIGYYPDRSDARKSAEHFTEVLCALYDWMSMKQAKSVKNPNDACRAKTSIIAHSMGNYLVECAMNLAWTRNNRPLLMSLINQYIMVAADVDNDIFRAGESVQHGDGEGIANLTYRVTAMYTGRDSVLGMSAGLKHFGKRRLGRSGLDKSPDVKLPDNVWDIDCTHLIDLNRNGMQVHGAYFDELNCYMLMRDLLAGIDRSVLIGSNRLPLAMPKTQGGLG